MTWYTDDIRTNMGKINVLNSGFPISNTEIGKPSLIHSVIKRIKWNNGWGKCLENPKYVIQIEKHYQLFF